MLSPQTLGPYHIVGLIAEGGMGEVYRARQTEPVKRDVALKVIKPGLDTKAVIARFEAERQALAMMNHPGIAQVFDAGATEQGRPYFVMELIDGVPLIQFCVDQNLPLPERLELFISICHATQHAHQKGIIHRDLKPSNILVTKVEGRPSPKIIDFGIAKATAGSVLTDKTLVTKFSQVLGTPAYMSPEQLDLTGLDLDTRSDVYALGSILYELITDQLPFDSERLANASQTALEQILWEEDPPLPSHRVSSDQTRSSRLRGDLDWIVMRAMHKDRNHRYETASALADDIRHFLNDQPVAASPPSTSYHVGKFVRRHRLGLGFAASLLVLLVAGISISLWQAIRATQSEKREATQRQVAEATVDFLTEDLLGMSDPNKEPDRDIKLSTVLDRATESMTNRFEEQPEVKARILNTLGRTYEGTGEFEKTIKLLQETLTLWRRLGRENDRDFMLTEKTIAYSYFKLRRFQEASELLTSLLEKARKTLGPEDAVTLEVQTWLARVSTFVGDYERSLALNESAYAIYKKQGRERERVALSCLTGIGSNYLRQGLPAEAEVPYRKVWEIARVDYPLDFPPAIAALHNLGAALMNQGKSKEAVPILEEALERARRVQGEDHPDVLLNIYDMAGVYFDIGDHARAVEFAREAWEKREKRFGAEDVVTLESQQRLGELLADTGQREKAIPIAEDLVMKAHRSLGDSHRITNWAFDVLENAWNEEPARVRQLVRQLSGGSEWPTSIPTVRLVDRGASWKIFDQGGPVDDQWNTLAFDTTEWNDGTSPLGYGESDLAHEVSFGRDNDAKHPATYLRHRFTFPEETPARLRLRIRRDDGAAVFLNGSEVLRHHLPKNATHLTFADIAVGDLEEKLYYVVDLNPKLLTSDNVLAVQVHQCNGKSSDLMLDLILEYQSR